MEKVWSPDSYQTVRNKSSAVTRQEMNCDVEYEPSLQNLKNTNIINQTELSKSRSNKCLQQSNVCQRNNFKFTAVFKSK